MSDQPQLTRCVVCNGKVSINVTSCPHCWEPRLVETTCPECNGTVWTTERGCLFWFIAIFLFPLGLLVFLQQRKWRCVECDYFYHSYHAPASVKYFGSSAAEYISSDEGPSQEDIDEEPSQEDIDQFS